MYYYCSWQLESTSYATKINNLRKITKVMITKLVQELFKTFSPQILMDFADISSVAESIYGFIISWNANQQIQEFLQLPGLLTKLPFSTGDLKDIKKYLFCYMKMLVWIGNKWANTTERKFSLVAYKIKYEGVSKEGGILKVDIKKMFFDVIQSWRFLKAAEAKTKKLSNWREEYRKERKRISK